MAKLGTESRQQNPEHFLSLDDAFAFASRLRGDPSQMQEPGTYPEFSSPAWRVKVYNGGRRVPLPGALPWWMDPACQDGKPDVLQQLGVMLFNSAGITRVRWNQSGTVLSSPQHPGFAWPELQLTMRRAVPSGGGSYPNEVYVASVAGPLGESVFHYDAGRHELIDLRHDNPAAALRFALRWPPEKPLPPFALMLTHRFNKNLPKYRNFAYRLGAVDAGIVLGRLLAGAQVFFGQACIHFDFDDAALNTMCGLDGQEESVYAILLPGTAGPASYGSHPVEPPSPPSVLERAPLTRPSSIFAAMHAAACRFPNTLQLRETPAAASPEAWIPQPGATPLVPPLGGLKVERRELYRRTSNGAWFTGEAVSMEILATVLHRTWGSVQTLLQSCADACLPAIDLYCAVERVAGIPSGWYRYLAHQHVLVPTGTGHAPSTTKELQAAIYSGTVDVERSAFSVHAATVNDFRSDPRGVRAYRIQQMLVGAAVEATATWSSATGAGSHPLHGFNVHSVDHMYGLDSTPFGVQSQVSVGKVRPSGILEGSVIV